MPLSSIQLYSDADDNDYKVSHCWSSWSSSVANYFDINTFRRSLLSSMNYDRHWGVTLMRVLEWWCWHFDCLLMLRLRNLMKEWWREKKRKFIMIIGKVLVPDTYTHKHTHALWHENLLIIFWSHLFPPRTEKYFIYAHDVTICAKAFEQEKGREREIYGFKVARLSIAQNWSWFIFWELFTL